MNNVWLSQAIKLLQKALNLKNSPPQQVEYNAGGPDTVPVDETTESPSRNTEISVDLDLHWLQIAGIRKMRR